MAPRHILNSVKFSPYVGKLFECAPVQDSTKVSPMLQDEIVLYIFFLYLFKNDLSHWIRLHWPHIPTYPAYIVERRTKRIFELIFCLGVITPKLFFKGCMKILI